MKAWKLSLIAAATASSGAYAVQPEGMAFGSGVTFYPGVEIGIKDDSNIYRRPSGAETSSVITTLKPNAGLVADFGASRLNAYLQAESGSYDYDSNDNYLDTLLVLGGDFELTSRQKVVFDASLSQSHDARGYASAEVVGGITEPSEYDQTILGARYEYGADTAFANVAGYVGSDSKKYTNNPTVTDDLTHDKVKIGAELALRISSATRALLDVRQTTISYDTTTGQLKDGSELRLLAGVSWDITGKTTGSFKIGNVSRSFDGSAFKNASSASWEGDLSWSPRSYSVVTVNTSKGYRESTSVAQGSTIANSTYGVKWNHQFSRAWALESGLNLRKDDYVDAAPSRSDKTTGINLAGIYSPISNVDVKATFEKSKRTSSDSVYEYDQRILGMAVELAF
jgi:polysaccharide biosynthesis protein VpsM